MKCGHCPRGGAACRGESVPRLCQLVDPSHPDHRPEYLSALEPTTPAYPPLATQARNLAGAVGRFVASGLKTVSKREYRRRRAICEGCPLYDAAQARCTQCGCSVAVKPWSKAEHCPEGKW